MRASGATLTTIPATLVPWLVLVSTSPVVPLAWITMLRLTWHAPVSESLTAGQVPKAPCWLMLMPVSSTATRAPAPVSPLVMAWGWLICVRSASTAGAYTRGRFKLVTLGSLARRSRASGVVTCTTWTGRWSKSRFVETPLPARRRAASLAWA